MPSHVDHDPRPASAHARLRRTGQAILAALLAGLAIFAASKAFAASDAPAYRADAVATVAEARRIVRFGDSAHSPMTGALGRFLPALVDELRPIATKAGDGPPSPR